MYYKKRARNLKGWGGGIKKARKTIRGQGITLTDSVDSYNITRSMPKRKGGITSAHENRHIPYRDNAFGHGYIEKALYGIFAFGAQVTCEVVDV